MDHKIDKIKMSNISSIEEYKLICKDIMEFEKKILHKKNKVSDCRKELEKTYQENMILFNQITKNFTTFYKQN